MMADVEDEFNHTVNLSYIDYSINSSSSSSQDVLQEARYFQFIFWVIIVPIIVCFGLVGNTLTMFVLFRREMQSSTVLYLRALVLTDSIILLLAVSILTPFSMSDISPGMTYYRDVVYPITFIYTNYIIMTLRTCNVWITVCVTVERYIAICHPFDSPRITTIRKTLIVILSVLVFSIAFNIPRLIFVESRECETKTDCYYLTTEDKYYKEVYVKRMYTIFLFVIPLAVLVLLNIRIVFELVKMAKRRRATSGATDEGHDETNVSIVLVSIVVIFIICQTPAAVLLVLHDISRHVSIQFVAVGNTMIILNSSVNFLIYVFIGRKFRKVFVKTICCRYGTSESTARVNNV